MIFLLVMPSLFGGLGNHLSVIYQGSNDIIFSRKRKVQAPGKSSQSTESGAGEQFLPLDCVAKVRAQGSFLFADAGTCRREPDATLERRASSDLERTKGVPRNGGRK